MENGHDAPGVPFGMLEQKKSTLSNEKLVDLAKLNGKKSTKTCNEHCSQFPAVFRSTNQLQIEKKNVPTSKFTGPELEELCDSEVFRHCCVPCRWGFGDVWLRWSPFVHGGGNFQQASGCPHPKQRSKSVHNQPPSKKSQTTNL